MVTRIVKYKNFNGEDKEKALMFHYTTLELSNKQISVAGGLKAYLASIVEKKDENASLKFIQDYIIDAYGEKSEDGERFIKSEALKKDLQDSAAFSQLLSELYADENALLEFIKSITPDAA